MRLTFMGTAAAEGFPAVFCNCEYCREARRLGGKNIRTRSQSLVNDDLLIDLPADTYSHFLQNGIQGDAIKYLLITHGHSDHCYPNELLFRSGCFAHNQTVPTLKVICSSHTFSFFAEKYENVEFVIVKAFDVVELDGYRITALPAKHMWGGEPLIYLIEGEKTILYGHDTGYLYEEVFEYIKEKKITIDMVTLDCTNVDIPISDSDGHMGYPNISRVLKRLSDIGAITEKTVRYVNHFSHNGNPAHHLMQRRAADIGCLAAYDGCVVEF